MRTDATALYAFFVFIQAKFLSQTQINGKSCEQVSVMTYRPDITSNKYKLV